MVFDTDKPILLWFDLEYLVSVANLNKSQSFFFVLRPTEVKVTHLLPESNLVVRFPFNNKFLPALIGVGDNDLLIKSLHSTNKTPMPTLKGHDGSMRRNKVSEITLGRQ